MSDDDNDERHTLLRTLDRGLRVLETVAAGDGSATAKVLSRQLDIKIGTCYHLLRTLVVGGYVVRLSGGRYDVGPKAASLSRHLQRRSGPSPELAVVLARLHARTQETSYLAGWYHGSLVLQHYLTGAHTLHVAALDVGYSAHTHARASCRAVLAHLPPEQVAVMYEGLQLAPLTPHTITDFEQLTVELAAVRRQGYAIEREEFTPGVACVSAAFFKEDGAPAGAFAVAVPVSRFDERRDQLVVGVREAASMATSLLRTGRLGVPARFPSVRSDSHAS
ncbi:IclR family transcriptional regulator [Streptomyces sp. NPDC046870]|uniref:IclR family transcriptional regulator n=1 Tax=Streptomyces sp. NPDC046870 TaxID=3155135 RepID=UPI003454C837